MIGKLIYIEQNRSGKVIPDLHPDYKDDIKNNKLYYFLDKSNMIYIFDQDAMRIEELIELTKKILGKKKSFKSDLDLKIQTYNIINALTICISHYSKIYPENDFITLEYYDYPFFVNNFPVLNKKYIKDIEKLIDFLIEIVEDKSFYDLKKTKNFINVDYYDNIEDLMTLENFEKIFKTILPKTDYDKLILSHEIEKLNKKSIEYNFISIEKKSKDSNKKIVNDSNEKIDNLKNDKVINFLNEIKVKKKIEEDEFGLVIADPYQLEYLIDNKNKLNEKDSRIIDEIERKVNLFIKNKIEKVDLKTIDKLNELDIIFPNFKEVTNFFRKKIKLSYHFNMFKFEPIIIQGYYGIGKTEYFRKLNNILNISSKYIDGSSIDSKMAINGLSFKWGTGSVGLILENLNKLKTINPMFILDEADKINSTSISDGLLWSVFYSLLDKESSKSFFDRALEIEIDTSNINWVFLCNDLSQIPIGIKNRTKIFKIKSPNDSEKVSMINSIYKDLIQDEPFNTMKFKDLEYEIIKKLLNYNLREIKNILKETIELAFIKNYESGCDDEIIINVFNLQLT